jgi:hypothetical protein
MRHTSNPLYREAELWAQLDGCEPGDLLRQLVDVAETATDGYGYALSGTTQSLIHFAIRKEIAAHEEWVNSGEIYEYQERDYVEEVLKEIHAIRNGTDQRTRKTKRDSDA